MLLLSLPWTGPASAAPGDESACEQAIGLSEVRYGLPPGLLLAIAQVETGLQSGPSGERRPWPWSINVNGNGRYFQTKAEAAAWTRAAQAGGGALVDVGCLQVNLQNHPAAFSSVEEGLDPLRNADYAGRFLRDLAAEVGGDWIQAAGLYHSRRPELAQRYRLLVQARFGGAALPGPGLGPVRTVQPPRQVALSARAAWAERTAMAAARAAGAAPAERETLLRLLLLRAGLPGARLPGARVAAGRTRG